MTSRASIKIAVCALAVAAVAASFLAARKAYAKPNTNMSVESDGSNFFDNQFEAEEKFAIPIDEATEFGFNEKGDPAVKRSF